MAWLTPSVPFAETLKKRTPTCSLVQSRLFATIEVRSIGGWKITKRNLLKIRPAFVSHGRVGGNFGFRASLYRLLRPHVFWFRSNV